MRSARRKGFALSGIFMILAQVFVVAFCGLTAVAVTQEETAQNLYSNEHGSASMSYELLENDRIKWTLNLVKGAHDSPTRFMVDIAADGVAVMPENVQTNNPAIALTSGNGDGYIQAGLSEASGGSPAGSATITFETARSIDQLTVKPKMLTEVPVATTMAAATTETADGESADANLPPETETVNLLEGVTKTTFTIPAVEVVEEPDPVVPEEVAVDTEEDAGVNADEPVVVTESEEDEVKSETEKANIKKANTLAASMSEGVQDTNTNDSTNWTSLRAEKDWSTSPEDSPAVTLQVMRKLKDVEGAVYQPYDVEGNGEYDYTLARSQSVMEWNKLPVYETVNGIKTGPYEYTVRELDNQYYEIDQDYESPTKSAINRLVNRPSCEETELQVANPSFIVVRHGGTSWTIWTASHLPEAERKDFIDSLKETIGPKGDTPSSHFYSDVTVASTNVKWIEGDVKVGGTENNPAIRIKVDAGDTGNITVTLTFSGSNIWTQLFYGSHSMREVGITNTYIPQMGIEVQKEWNDQNNIYNNREEIRLELQQKIDGQDWEPYDHFDIGLNDTIFSKSFEVPSRVNKKAASYRVVELVKVGEDQYEKRSIKGYAPPAYSSDDNEDFSHEIGISQGTLIVTNTLIDYDITVKKIWNDNGNEHNTRKDIGLVLQRWLTGDSEWKNVAVHDIAKGATTAEAFTETFTVPSVVDGKDAKYRVVEKMKTLNSTGGTDYVETRLPGYQEAVYSEPREVTKAAVLTVTNNLLKTNLAFTKVGNDGRTPLPGVSFTLTGSNAAGDNAYNESVNSMPITGGVAFADLLEGNYTLAETALTGYKQAGPWDFAVVYDEETKNLQLV